MKAQEQIRETGIIWTAKTEYYDIETGDEITKTQFTKHNYIKIKTEKHVTRNSTNTRGTVTYRIIARRHPQTKINFTY